MRYAEGHRLAQRAAEGVGFGSCGTSSDGASEPTGFEEFMAVSWDFMVVSWGFMRSTVVKSDLYN